MGKEKIAPELRALMTRFREKGHQGLRVHMKTMGLVSKENSPKPSRVNVFLECDPANPLEDLAPEGILVNGRAGGLRTAFLPVSALGTLAGSRAVRRILPSHLMRYSLDVASEKVHLPPFRQKNPLKGKGILMGIIDSGIDPHHPMFEGRILRIWDQTLSGEGVPEANFGVELTRKEQFSQSRDYVGHGTHVAGIAAGDDETYCGVAPKADLLIVKTDMKDTSIANGIQYIFRVAGELKRPAVVNMSLGSHAGAHDGTDPLSRIIDQETGPGKIVCCAAGNEGDSNIHASLKVTGQEKKTVRFFIPGGTSPDREAGTAVILNGWYPGGDQLKVAVASPRGLKTPDQEIQPGEEDPTPYTLGDNLVTIITPGPDPGNNDMHFEVTIENRTDPNLPITSGVWRLILTGQQVKKGTVDIWSLTTLEEDIPFTGSSVQDSMKIGYPGSAKTAITVASYTTRNRWTNRYRQDLESEFELDDISSFSSEGPLRNGILKPDVAAPGAWIISALSADSEVVPDFSVGGGFQVMPGTSMASPFIAGIAALLLERDPAADPAAIKAALMARSRIPGKKAGSHDWKWGYGFIDMTDL